MNRRPKAFTLVEMLVALSILLILLSSVYGVFATASRNLQVVEARAELTQTARVVLGDLRRELGSVYPMWVPLDEEQRAELGVEAPEEGVVSFAGEEGETREGQPGDNLRFTAAVRGADEGGTKRFDLCELLYQLDEDKDTVEEGLVRQCNYRPGLAVDDQPDLETREITRLATSLNIQYWSDDEESLEADPDADGWLDGWSDPATLPVAVKLVLGLTPDGPAADERRYTMIVRLPIRVPKPAPSEEEGGAAGEAAGAAEGTGGAAGGGDLSGALDGLTGGGAGVADSLR